MGWLCYPIVLECCRGGIWGKLNSYCYIESLIRNADEILKKYHSIAQSGKPLEEILTKEELQAILGAGKRKVYVFQTYVSPHWITVFRARPFRVGDKTNEFPPLDPAIERQNETGGEDERDFEEGEYEEGEDGSEEVEYEVSATGGKDDKFEEVTEIKSFQTQRDASNVNDEEFDTGEHVTASAAQFGKFSTQISSRIC